LLGGLDAALDDIRTLHDRPSGTVRINASLRAAEALMQRIVPTFLQRYPDVQVDLVTDGRWVNVVAEGFDLGVRLGEAVPQDMIALPFCGEERFVAVATPAYLDAHGRPEVPDDLMRHQCVRFRLPSGKIYRWEFEHRGQELALDVAGPLTLDTMPMAAHAALAGLGIAFVSLSLVRDALADGQAGTAARRLDPALPRPAPLLSQPPPAPERSTRVHRPGARVGRIPRNGERRNGAGGPR
jgi:DNA-binding transcriptional LysR family regulator